MAEYMVIILGDADRWWTSMSLKERQDGYAQYAALNADLAAGGHRIVGGAELKATSTGRSIRAGGDVVTDGPYTETAEQVGGFYLVDTDDLEGLTECFKRIARLGDGIEIRPTVSPEDRAP